MDCERRVKTGYGPARTIIGVMTNPFCIALQMQGMCPNRNGYTVHGHVQLDGGTTKTSQICAPELCRAACKGLVEQMEADRNEKFLLMRMEHDESQSSKDLSNTATPMNNTQL